MYPSEQERLIKLINHIAINNISVGDESAVAAVVADHVRKFWSRRMKEQLTLSLQQSANELHPAARLAAESLLQAS
ncbi:formate dehydrogenase subunit delta [Oceanobacter mangrovi]|uniref:formate dehydrogenase subunit delta n=1 Tax=Oceanobacter mangrovi TaxID=2862510 RepID=UPI001C8E3302|nr:formate dehydrogenase subunit delta [Oceanobacter mangrovi]